MRVTPSATRTGGVEILDERELDVELHRLRRHGDERVLLGRVDGDELHVLAAILLFERLEYGQVRAERRGKSCW